MDLRRPTLLACLVLVAGCPTRPKHGDPPRLAITSPEPDSYANGYVSVKVGVTGEPDMPVTVLLDGLPLPDPAFPPNYTLAWDTRTVSEGAHTLTASLQYGEEHIRSLPVTVNVDRTPPAVVSMTPAPGADRVALRAPITVAFSEPILPSSFPARALTADGDGLPSTTTFAADRKSARITLDDPNAASQVLVFPSTFAISLTGITDRAGNGLASPEKAWTWMVPAWVKFPALSSNAGSFDLAVDPDQRPIIVRGTLMGSGMGTAVNLLVSKHDGDKWIDFGPATRPDGNSGAYGMSAEVAPDGTLVIAYTEFSEVGRVVRVASHESGVWMFLPPVQVRQALDTIARDPVLRLDESGRPVVAWRETLGLNDTTGLFVWKWDGSAWDRSMPGLGFFGAWAHDLALRGGSPVVGWRSESGTGVSLWSAGTWQQSPSLTELAAPHVVLSPSGAPWMLGNGPTFVVNELSGGRWTPAIAKPLPASNAATSPHLTTAPDGAPVVGWVDAGPPARATFARWTGTAWDARVGLFSAMNPHDPSRTPEVVVDRQGTIWVAWFEDGGTRIYVWMSNY